MRSSAQPPQFTEDTLIVEAEQYIDWRALKAYYKSVGIKCYLCPAAEIETFAQGAKIHKFDLQRTLGDLGRLAQTSPLGDPPKGAWARLMGWVSDKLKDRPHAPSA